jgi:hypothetical protein
MRTHSEGMRADARNAASRAAKNAALRGVKATNSALSRDVTSSMAGDL